MPVEAMSKPVWHAHVVLSPELRVQMNRTQRAAQAGAERAAAAAEKGRARSRSLMERSVHLRGHGRDVQRKRRRRHGHLVRRELVLGR